MKTVTVGQMLDFGCNIDGERIRGLAGGKTELTALDVLALDGLSAAKRLNLVLCEGFLDAALLHEFACRLAEGMLDRIERPDPRSIDVLAVKRRWARGEATDDELAAARDAAWAAARAVGDALALAAARAAARASAYASACAPAERAARATAWHAARAAYAARAAVRDDAMAAASAARAAERERQIAELRRLIAESEKGRQG
jgi:hypothetical protein